MHRKFNGKLFAVLILLGGALGVGVHFLHGYQVERSARTLRERVDAAVREGDPEKARHALTRYLTYMPRDADALEEFGKIVRGQGDAALALSTFGQILELDPTRSAVRRQVVDLALQLGDASAAAAHVRQLLQELPEENTLERAAQRGDLYQLLAQCHEAKARHAEAAETYGRATRHAPDLIDAFLRQATLLREHLKQPRQADAVIARLVEANPNAFRAYYERARYRLRWQQGGAEDDMAQARALARKSEPNDADGFLTAADLAQQEGDMAEARRYLIRALERFPGDRRFYARQARLEQQVSRPQDAVAALRLGLTVLPGDRELRVFLVEALLAAGQADEATQELLALRQEKDCSPVLLAYLDAHLMMRNQQWAAASQVLESIREPLGAVPELRGEADRLLGQCYDKLGDREQYFTTLQRAISDAVRSGSHTGPVRYQLGVAFLAAGRFAEALGELGHAAYSPGGPPQTYLRLTEATLAYGQQLPAEQRPEQWAHVEGYLNVAATLLPDSVEVPLLRAQALTVQDKFAEAEAVLRQARAQLPGKVQLWAGHVALLLRRGGDTAAVLALLDEAQRALGDTADLRLLRAQYWTVRATGTSRAALLELEKDLGKFNADDQARLLTGLAEARYRTGDLRDAEQLWQRYLELRPSDLRVRQILFELALLAGNDEVVQKALAELQQVEGQEGVYWRTCAVMRLLYQGRRVGAGAPVAEVRQLIAEIRTRRPKWARLLVLEGELAELTGKPEEAVARYQEAVDQGERSLRLIQRTVELLNQTKQYQAVDRLIAKLGETAPAADTLRWLAIDASLRGHDLERAEVVARTAVLANPNDFRQQLWLGQVLAAANKAEEAETTLLKATELGGHAPETWLALVRHQAGRDKGRATASVEKARATLLPDVALQVLGPCYELLGQREQADAHYQTALNTRPNDPAMLRIVAQYYTRAGQVAKAEELLRRLLLPTVNAPEPLAAWARRTLALSMAERDYRQVQQALLWLEENLRRLGNSPADLRVKAILLDRPGRRREAIQILEQLAKLGPYSPSDQLALARLHEGVLDWPRADQVYGALVANRSDPPVLAHYARGLLRQGELDRARKLADRLKQVEPKGLAAQEIKARLLTAEGHGDQAAERLLSLLQQAKEPAAVSFLANLLEDLGQAAAAEKAYRLFLEQSKQPDNALGLARFLGRQGRVAEALDLCERFAPQLPPEAVAGAMVVVLRAGKADKDQGQRVERWLTAALDAGTKAGNARAPLLWIPLADLYDYQGRYADAVKLYRNAAALNPNDHVAANNLAWLVAAQAPQGAADALRRLNHVIDHVTGPVPTLLDTRASVNLALNKPADAIQDLQIALMEAPSGIRCFHLALAYRQAGKPEEAKDAVQMTKAWSLDLTTLHPLEQPVYQQLLAEFGME